MQTDGYVSLWTTEETDAIKLRSAVEVRYSEDGDWITPPFGKAFSIDRFAESMREADVLNEATSSMRAALSGFSYDGVITDRFVHAFGEKLAMQASSVVLLYDYRFAGTPSIARIDGCSWCFVGAVPYR